MKNGEKSSFQSCFNNDSAADASATTGQSVVLSDLDSLTSSMSRFFSIDSIAIFRSKFFSAYFRNPKQSIRGFPCLPGGLEYSSVIDAQRVGCGGGVQDRVPVVLDIQLGLCPKGGVWVVAEIKEYEAGQRSMEKVSEARSCASLLDLKALFR